MILASSLRLAGTIHGYLYAYAPSNILARYLRSPGRRKWAFAVSTTLSAGYLASSAGLTAIIEAGGPGWLNLLVLTCAWDAIKFFVVGGASFCACLVRRLRAIYRFPATGLFVGGQHK
jgi:hypothetical protein